MTTAADAILAAVDGGLPADVTVYDTLVPYISTPRYVILYIPTELRVDSGIIGVSTDLAATFYVISVVSNDSPAYASAMCRWLAATVRDILTDLQISPDGMSPAQIRHEGSQNPRADEITPDKKVYATAQFSYQTVRN